MGGTLFPRLTDHHVHLGLVDPVALFSGGITHAVDLGWDPAIATSWLRDDPRSPSVTIAGALLTAPGGYPARSGWAPVGAAREVGGAREARRAVREQVMAGASRIKVALNSEAGETVDDATLDAIVEEAVTAGLPVVAHAQGTGQTARAVRAGVTQLAHTPFSERVPATVIDDAVARGMSWISTLDIHGWGTPTRDHDTAVDNLRRFHAARGRVLYGTDLGNGPLRLGVNARELTALLSAGLDATTVLRSIAGDPGADHLADEAPIGSRLAWIPAAPPRDAALLPAWLATARGLQAGDLTATDLHTPISTPTTSTEGPLP
nr:amidohydrolase family protein [Leifsonia naganoensis]